MSKPSRRVTQGLLMLHFHKHLISPAEGGALSSFRGQLTRAFSSASNGFSNSQIQRKLPSNHNPTFSSHGGLSQILSPPSLAAETAAIRMKNSSFPKLGPNSSAFSSRFFCFKARDFSRKVNEGFAKKVFEKPAAAVSSAFSRYREAIGLQVEAFAKRNYLFLLGVGGVLVCALLWRIMFGIANTFVHLSEGMAKYGFLALSSAIVILTGIYIRSRFTINPDKVYRMAMRKLNTSAGILEVMGAPLAGSDIRAYVMSGGGFKLKSLKANLRSKRCFLIFPIRGSERRGLVSVEVKKKKGQYDTKLLAVDVPMPSGRDQRFFIIGDEEEYRIAGGLISELRDPLVKAMASTEEFDHLDQIEEEKDAERELLEAETKNREEIDKLENEGSK